MERKTITKQELDEELENHVDPLRDLPAGFPMSHSRFPAIPSYAFVEDTANIDPAAGAAPDSSADIAAAQAAIRAELQKLFPTVA